MIHAGLIFFYIIRQWPCAYCVRFRGGPKGSGIAMDTANGRLANPLATSFRFLDLLIYYLNLKL